MVGLRRVNVRRMSQNYWFIVGLSLFYEKPSKEKFMVATKTHALEKQKAIQALNEKVLRISSLQPLAVG